MKYSKQVVERYSLTDREMEYQARIAAKMLDDDIECNISALEGVIKTLARAQVESSHDPEIQNEIANQIVCVMGFIDMFKYKYITTYKDELRCSPEQK